MEEPYNKLIQNSVNNIHRERVLPIICLILIVVISAIEVSIICLVQYAFSITIRADLVTHHFYAFVVLFLLDILTIYQFITINRWNAALARIATPQRIPGGSLFQINWTYYTKAKKMVILHCFVIFCCVASIIFLLLAEQVKVKGLVPLVLIVKIYNFLASLSIGIVSCYLILEIGYLVKWYRRGRLFRMMNRTIIDEIPKFKELEEIPE
ncbi:MAG: hypothetical protein RBG13Loki_3953 [Promethearchaeota archaeon CR_4]|nr:MAG: hypothetical protein RBG13Loki_3953 [Candidatus Lokiarchaeota archaeon CR_4]